MDILKRNKTTQPKRYSSRNTPDYAMRSNLFFIAIGLISTCHLKAQIRVNGGFEQLNFKKLPELWDIGGSPDYYRIKIDSQIRKEGKYSLLIDGSSNDSTFRSGRSYLSLHLYLDSSIDIKTIEVTAWVRSTTTTDSTVSIYVGEIPLKRRFATLSK